jgi:light-regulated signal transduction histidine kinase (bacteriophytochrome)
MTRQTDIDPDACAREPIHIPGSIQPHGALLVLSPADLTLLQASANAEAMLGFSPQLGAPLPAEAGEIAKELRQWLSGKEAAYQRIVERQGRRFHAAAHRSGESVILELEALQESSGPGMEQLFPKLKDFAQELNAAWDLRALSALAARYLRELTGFDRVLVYRFDGDWNGQVVGESGNGALPSYLDLRFPASDIPAQARELYKLNRLRIIPDAGYVPVPILPPLNPATGEPVDLSFALLRSVSPVHLEYMRNMKTAASMSVSIIVDGGLWGLVSCHSREPHHVPLTLRNLCDFAVQTLAAEIGARRRGAEAARRVQLGAVMTRLLARMTTASDWRRRLIENCDDLLAQVGANGAAILFDGDCRSAGSAPREDQVRAIVSWLEARGEMDLFATDSLAALMDGAESFADVASGVLAVRISELHPSWLLWFRPELVQTVTWGGDPHKMVTERGRIHPRRSFEAWKQQVRGHAAPWTGPEIAAARDLRAAIIGIVLRRAEELAGLSEELQRSNQELEAFSYSISHDLRAPFRHIVGYSELLREREKNLDPKSRHFLESIVESALAAGRLVDDLLNFSHIGRASITARPIDMNKLVAEVRHSLAAQEGERRIVWQMEDLPTAWGDAALIRQVWFNLLENAVKYTRPRAEASITVTGWAERGETCYRVEDNGVGFNMAYREKLFGVFQRLQRSEDFEGTGIGLALARRILERHGGRIWAEGELDKGARFYFALPTEPALESHG